MGMTGGIVALRTKLEQQLDKRISSWAPHAATEVNSALQGSKEALFELGRSFDEPSERYSCSIRTFNKVEFTAKRSSKWPLWV